MSKLANAKKLSDVSAADYDAVFYVGGHGPVLDLASDPVNAKLASDVRLSAPRTRSARLIALSRVCSSTAQAR